MYPPCGLRAVTLVVVAVLLALGTPTASATLIWNFGSPPANGYTIQEVQDSGGLQVGDKLFADFDVVTTATSGVSAPDPATIRLRGVQIAGDFGLEFNGGWATASGQSINTNITFSVTAGPSHAIVGNYLWMTAYGTAGDGLVSIVENVFAQNPGSTPTPTLLGSKFVRHAVADPLNQASDSAAFSPHQTVWVTKDITVRDGSTTGPGMAHLSRFYQTFNQIPEPATLLLLGAGAMRTLGRRANRA